MDTTKDDVYYIVPQGATQEEACSWQELESACQMGRLSPDTLIYLPDKDVWEKAIFTELRQYFRAKDDQQQENEADGEDDNDTMEALRTAYDEALQEARIASDSSEAHLKAARAAMAIKDREAAVGHCQQAIDLCPYHPEVTADIKRILGPMATKKLHRLERPAPFWEDLYPLVTFPIQRGITLFVVPASVVAVLALFSFLRPAAAVISFFWAYATILQVASGDRNPFDFRKILSKAATKMIKPFLLGMSAVAELYLSFFFVAEFLILVGISDRPNVIQFIQHSEVMIVFMWVAGVLYLPAAFAVSAGPGAGWKKVLDVRSVYKAILAMEMEYLATVVVLFVPVTIWGAGRLFLGSIPVAGILIPVAVGLYGMSISGFVIGLLSVRHRHHWTKEKVIERESSLVDFQ